MNDRSNYTGRRPRRNRSGLRGWSLALMALVASMTAATSATAAPSRNSSEVPASISVWNKLSLLGPGTAVPTEAELTALARSAAPATAAAGGSALFGSAQTALTPCQDDPQFLCGSVVVPLDRRSPDGRIVNIHFEVFPHTGPQPRAEGAVFVTCGGPGCSITAGPKYGFAFFLLPAVAQTRDLVFIDQRGVGLSDVIDCPQFQAGGPLYESAAACHDQLGDTANLYSTTDVADDIDDVRSALGYEQIDVFGGSYAGVDMITYAQRHTDRVRSVVLASPAMVVDVDPFYAYPPEAMPRIVANVCGRSPACG
jgi:hypothetical protein